VLYNDYGDDDDEDEVPYYENPAITDGETSSNDVFELTADQTSQLLNLFREAAPEGELDRVSFEAVFASVLGQNNRALRSTLSKLFNLFDRDGNGLVDAREFHTGLAVISSTTSGESRAVREAFEAYDLDGNGLISLEEMITYLTSVFAVIATSSPEVWRLLNKKSFSSFVCLLFVGIK
jgi:Ca2+-binding EF-hand superfamily protein